MNRQSIQSKGKKQSKTRIKSGGTTVSGPKAPKRRHG